MIASECLNVFFFPLVPAEVMLGSQRKEKQRLTASDSPQSPARLGVCSRLPPCVHLEGCVLVAFLHYISHGIGGLEKWVSVSHIVASRRLSSLRSCPPPPSLSYSQAAPRIKMKHLQLSTPPAAAWIWVKPAKSITHAVSFPPPFVFSFC